MGTLKQAKKGGAASEDADDLARSALLEEGRKLAQRAHGSKHSGGPQDGKGSRDRGSRDIHLFHGEPVNL
jgi:hypothetical protein